MLYSAVSIESGAPMLSGITTVMKSFGHGASMFTAASMGTRG
jgi:hypothetical protein